MLGSIYWGMIQDFQQASLRLGRECSGKIVTSEKSGGGLWSGARGGLTEIHKRVLVDVDFGRGARTGRTVIGWGRGETGKINLESSNIRLGQKSEDDD